MTKRFSTLTVAAAAIAIGAAVLAGSTVSAQAGEHMKTLTSHTWKPGFTKDGNHFVKFVMVEDTGAGTTTGIESRSTWAVGFQQSGDGHYSRTVTRQAGRQPSLIAKVERRSTWAPGFSHDGDGQFTRVAHIATGTSAGTMMAGDAGGGAAQVAEAR